MHYRRKNPLANNLEGLHVSQAVENNHFALAGWLVKKSTSASGGRRRAPFRDPSLPLGDGQAKPGSLLVSKSEDCVSLTVWNTYAQNTESIRSLGKRLFHHPPPSTALPASASCSSVPSAPRRCPAPTSRSSAAATACSCFARRAPPMRGSGAARRAGRTFRRQDRQGISLPRRQQE